MGQYHGLGVEEELALFERARRGERAAVHELVERHRGLVGAIAHRYARASSGRLSKDDLEQEGILGLYHAITRYDPGHGTRFNTYARWWVRSYIQRVCEQARYTVTRPGGRDVRRFRQKGARTATKLRHRLEREPTREEIALELDIPVAAVEFELLAQQEGRAFVEERSDDDAAARTEVVLSAATDIVREAEQRETLERVREIFRRLPERQQRILVGRYVEDMTLEELGAEFGVTRERIRQLEVKAIKRLRKGLGVQEAAA